MELERLEKDPLSHPGSSISVAVIAASIAAGPSGVETGAPAMPVIWQS